jgi:hypothetical protein
MRNGRGVEGREVISGVITAFTFRYKRDKAFVATFKINEQ